MNNTIENPFWDGKINMCRIWVNEANYAKNDKGQMLKESSYNFEKQYSIDLTTTNSAIVPALKNLISDPYVVRFSTTRYNNLNATNFKECCLIETTSHKQFDNMVKYLMEFGK